MSAYRYTTRECSVNQLHPGLFQTVQEYFQAHQLGDPETEVRICCETTAEKQKTGRLAALLDGNPDTTVHLGIMLTNEWLVWARQGDSARMIVNGTKLKGLQVKTFITKRSKNMVLELNGLIGGTKDFVRGNLELGPEREAQKFCEEVERTVQSITPPAKKSRLRWFGH